MDKPLVRLIATDIDGTLLRPDGTLSERVRSSLWRAHEQGIHVVPATGRPSVVSRDIVRDLGLDGYWIFGNGAVTYHRGSGQTVRCFWMDPGLAEQVVTSLRVALPGAGFAFELDDEVAHEPGFGQRVPATQPISPPVEDVLSALSDKVHKVIVYHDDVDVDTLYARVVAAVGDEAVVSYSGLPFVEVATSLVTKATALSALCGDLGVDQAEVASFGDNHNDLPMLAWAGRGYAMANATADALQCADTVIGSNADDGLADAVDSIVAEYGQGLASDKGAESH